MSREPVLVYTYQLSTHYKNSEVAPGYLPNLQALTEALEAFRRSSEQYGAGEPVSDGFGLYAVYEF